MDYPFELRHAFFRGHRALTCSCLICETGGPKVVALTKELGHVRNIIIVLLYGLLLSIDIQGSDSLKMELEERDRKWVTQ